MPRGRACFGGGPAEERRGHPPVVSRLALVASEVARALPEYPRWARWRQAGQLRRLGLPVGLEAAGFPGPRCGGAESRPAEASEARAALGCRAVSTAPGSPRAPASAEDACHRGSARGGGECEYV